MGIDDAAAWLQYHSENFETALVKVQKCYDDGKKAHYMTVDDKKELEVIQMELSKHTVPDDCWMTHDNYRHTKYYHKNEQPC